MWKWLKWVLLSIVILLVILFAFKLVRNLLGLDKPTGKNNTVQVSNNKDCQKNPKPVFTAEFTDFNNLRQTAPLGSINAGSPGRAYVAIKGEAPDRPKTPLYAPADSKIISLVYARRDPNNPNAPGEYRLEFEMSCEVTFNFDHMDEVVDKIKAKAPSEPSNRSNDIKSVSIPVKAGELVGYSDGTDLAGTFDLFLLNTTKPVSHINPDRWKWDQVTHADCPYEYYRDDLKNKYYSIMKSLDNQELQTVSCGSPSHDVAGTASGGWFLGDSTDTTGKWLEIGNQNGKAELNFRESGSPYFSIRNYDPKILPEKLIVSNSICYFEQGKWAFIKLDNDTKLSVAKGEGSCPSEFPTSNAEIWER